MIDDLYEYSQILKNIQSGQKLVFPAISTQYLIFGSVAVLGRKGFLLIFSTTPSTIYNLTTISNESGITFSNNGLKLQMTFSYAGLISALLLFKQRKLSGSKITIED